MRMPYKGRMDTTDSLVNIVRQQKEWSEKTFGPGPRAEGLLRHIEKELSEVREDPTDVEEWVDIMLLAMDGAWRTGCTPAQVAEALLMKQAKNRGRSYPDWRQFSQDDPIEHEREIPDATRLFCTLEKECHQDQGSPCGL